MERTWDEGVAQRMGPGQVETRRGDVCKPYWGEWPWHAANGKAAACVGR